MLPSNANLNNVHSADKYAQPTPYLCARDSPPWVPPFDYADSNLAWDINLSTELTRHPLHRMESAQFNTFNKHASLSGNMQDAPNTAGHCKAAESVRLNQTGLQQYSPPPPSPHARPCATSSDQFQTVPLTFDRHQVPSNPAATLYSSGRLVPSAVESVQPKFERKKYSYNKKNSHEPKAKSGTVRKGKYRQREPRDLTQPYEDSETGMQMYMTSQPFYQSPYPPYAVNFPDPYTYSSQPIPISHHEYYSQPGFHQHPYPPPAHFFPSGYPPVLQPITNQKESDDSMMLTPNSLCGSPQTKREKVLPNDKDDGNNLKKRTRHEEPGNLPFDSPKPEFDFAKYGLSKDDFESYKDIIERQLDAFYRSVSDQFNKSRNTDSKIGPELGLGLLVYYAREYATEKQKPDIFNE